MTNRQTDTSTDNKGHYSSWTNIKTQQSKHIPQSHNATAQKNTRYNSTYQLGQMERGLSGSGPCAWRLLYIDFKYGRSHRCLSRTTVI